MPLVGGGGAGNVAGGNPAGTGTSLNYIGNHAYAYSGTFGATTGDQTMLNFTTGAAYVWGKIYCNGGVQQDDPSTGIISSWELSLDGQVIALMKTESATEDMPTTVENKILIPPYSKVQLVIRASGTGSQTLSSAVFTGRAYHA